MNRFNKGGVGVLQKAGKVYLKNADVRMILNQ